MGARAREIDEIVDSNTFFHHLMMATSAHFVCDRWILSNCCTCPAETETKCKTKSNSNSLIFSYSLSHHIRKFPFQLLTYRGEVLQQLIFFPFPFPSPVTWGQLISHIFLSPPLPSRSFPRREQSRRRRPPPPSARSPTSPSSARSCSAPSSKRSYSATSSSSSSPSSSSRSLHASSTSDARAAGTRDRLGAEARTAQQSTSSAGPPFLRRNAAARQRPVRRQATAT